MLVRWTKKIPVAMEKKKNPFFKQPTQQKQAIVVERPRPEICLDGSWPTQRIVLRMGSWESCIATSNIVWGVDCNDLAACPIIIQILQDITDLETDLTNICDTVANCIATNVNVQTELLNWLEALTNVNLTWTWNFWWPVTFTNTVDFTDSTITYTNTTQNYTAPTLISCEAVVAFGWTYTFPVNTDFVEVKVTNTAVQYTINKSINTGTNNYNVGSWVISVTVTAIDVTVTDISWVNTLDSICYYEGNIVNQNGTIYNNTNVTTYNTGSNTYNDSTTNTYGGNLYNTTINNPVINNPTFTGSIGIGMAWFNEPTPFTWGAVSTVLNLTNTPNGDILLSLEGWVIQLEPSDYTHVAGTNLVTMNIDTTGQNILVSYIIGTTGTLASQKLGAITRTPSGSSLVVVNPLSTATSVIDGITVTLWTPNGNYFDYDVSTPWQITFTSKDYLGNSIVENGIEFYYTIAY